MPSVMSLMKQLQEMIDKQQLKFCNPVCNALLSSLRRRFSGMLIRLQLHSEVSVDVNSLPFGSDIYVIASFFDPHFKFNWVSDSVDLPADDVQTLQSKLHTVVCGDNECILRK